MIKVILDLDWQWQMFEWTTPFETDEELIAFWQSIRSYDDILTWEPSFQEDTNQIHWTLPGSIRTMDRPLENNADIMIYFNYADYEWRGFLDLTYVKDCGIIKRINGTDKFGEYYWTQND